MFAGTNPTKREMGKIRIKIIKRREAIYLTSTNTHCNTPATPVHADRPVFTTES